MNKRNLASILGFLAGWMGGWLLVGLMTWPVILAVVPGFLLAVLIRLVPANVPSRSAAGRRIVPINEFAAELDRRGEKLPAAGANTRI